MSIFYTQEKRARFVFLGLPMIIIVGLLIRLSLLAVVANHPERGVSPDSESYLTPAVSLVTTGIYPLDDGTRTPMYPLFIALIYSFGGQDPILIMVAQILLDAVIIYLTYLLGEKLLPKPAALLGAFIMAINIDSITFDFYYLTETLSTFFTIAALLAFGKGCLENKGEWIAGSAILFGFSVLTRPIALYFPIVLIIWILLRKNASTSKRLIDVAIFSMTFLLVLLPWVVRNINVIGLPTVSTISNYNLFMYNAASLDAHMRGVSEEQVRPEFKAIQFQKLTELGLEDTPANRARVQSMLAKEIISSHPFQYVYVHLKSDLNSLLPNTNILELLGLTVGGKGTLSVLNKDGLVAAVHHYFKGNIWLIWILFPSILMLGFTYATSLMGSVLLIKNQNWFVLVLLLSTCVYFLLLPGAPSVMRFRVPVMPYLSLLSGLGAYTSYKFWFARETK